MSAAGTKDGRPRERKKALGKALCRARLRLSGHGPRELAAIACPPCRWLLRLLRPADLGHEKPERIAHDGVGGIRRDELDLKLCFPVGRRAEIYDVQIARRLSLTHLVGFAESNRSRCDGLLLRQLERVMAEAVGVTVGVEKVIRRAARMREPRIELLLVNQGIFGRTARCG